MERDADGLSVVVSERNLDVYLTSFYIFSEDPHLSFFVQHVDDRPFHIVLHLKILYNHLSLQRRDIELQQRCSILRTVIPEANTKYLCLDIKLIKKGFYFVNRYHIHFFR